MERIGVLYLLTAGSSGRTKEIDQTLAYGAVTNGVFYYYVMSDFLLK